MVQTCLQERLGTLQTGGKFFDNEMAIFILQDDVPERPRLVKVRVIALVVAADVTSDLERRLHVLSIGFRSGKAVREVVGSAFCVINHIGCTITLIMAAKSGRTIRTVDRNLHEVGAQTMTKRIRVAKQAALNLKKM